MKNDTQKYLPPSDRRELRIARIFAIAFIHTPFAQIRGFEIPRAWGAGKSEKNEKWPPKKLSPSDRLPGPRIEKMRGKRTEERKV
jgi:hypothetical protein